MTKARWHRKAEVGSPAGRLSDENPKLLHKKRITSRHMNPSKDDLQVHSVANAVDLAIGLYLRDHESAQHYQGE
jgi:hypothetical protein